MSLVSLINVLSARPPTGVPTGGVRWSV